MSFLSSSRTEAASVLRHEDGSVQLVGQRRKGEGVGVGAATNDEHLSRRLRAAILDEVLRRLDRGLGAGGTPHANLVRVGLNRQQILAVNGSESTGDTGEEQAGRQPRGDGGACNVLLHR